MMHPELSSRVGLSIVVACFQDDDRLTATLENLNVQGFTDDEHAWTVEVLVQDGACSQATQRVCEGFGSLVDYQGEADQGIYDGMNRGLARSRGQWVQFLNCGDTLHSPLDLRWLLTALMSAGSDSEWAISRALNLSAGPVPEEIPSFPFRRTLHALGLQPHCHQATWFKTSALMKSGGFSTDIGLAADHEAIMRFARSGDPLHFDRVLINYEGGGVSEGARAEIPRMLAANRARVYSIPSWAAVLDRVIVCRLVHGWQVARIFAGRCRRRYRSIKRIR